MGAGEQQRRPPRRDRPSQDRFEVRARGLLAETLRELEALLLAQRRVIVVSARERHADLIVKQSG
jgi:hypothetical protein